MRKEEEFVVDSLVKKLGGKPAIQGAEGEDPPDAYIIVNSRKIALEISYLTPVSFNEAGVSKNRISEDNVGFDITNELNEKLSSLVPSDSAVLLFLTVPIPKPSKFKKALERWLRENINSLQNEPINLSVMGVLVSARLIPRAHRKKQIVSVISNKDSSCDLMLNAKTVLLERIRIKEKKCLKILGEKWLGLINSNYLAEPETYKSILQEIQPQHGFSKIFLISSKGEVTEIFG